jgi:hypothetical protein
VRVTALQGSHFLQAGQGEKKEPQPHTKT